MKTFDPRTRSGMVTAAGASLLCFLVSGPVGAADFIRGDANGDGQVSISDSYRLLRYMFTSDQAPTCLEAADVNDDGRTDLSDSLDLLYSLFLGNRQPRLPFPAPGPDPTEPHLGCNSYGGAFPVEDPGAKIRLLDLDAPGGMNGAEVLTLAISNSQDVAGISVRIIDEAGTIDRVETRVTDLVFNGKVFFGHVSMDGKRIQVVCLPGDLPDFVNFYHPGQDQRILEIPICLRPGTPPGDYPLSLEAGELIDAGTGLPVVPALAGGRVTLADTVQDIDCLLPSETSGPPPVNVLFALGDGTGAPGDQVAIPFTVRATVESQGFSFSVDFDEGILRVESIEKLWQRPSGTPYEFAIFEFNNDDRTPGNAGIDEGFLVGAAIISLSDTSDVIPPRQLTDVLKVQFRVNPEAPSGETLLRFIDGGKVSGGPVFNKLITEGRVVTPQTADNFLLVAARIRIQASGIVFIRGDSSGDGMLNITDAVVSLSYLFLGGSAPPCLDAADANDDGLLDLADPIALLQALFLGETQLPPPLGEPGHDPTPDGLGCQG